MVDTSGDYRTFHKGLGTRTFARLVRLLLALGAIITLTCSTYAGGYVSALMNYEDALAYNPYSDAVQPTFWDYQLDPGYWMVAFLVGLLILAIVAIACYAVYALLSWIWRGYVH